jgi:hypothetical protein
MRILSSPTENFIKDQRATLDADSVAGTNVVLTLENNYGITPTEFVVVGRSGSERVEMAKAIAVSGGTQVTVDELLLAHRKGDPVTVFLYDKRKFYGSLTKEGVYTELSGSPVQIAVDDNQAAELEYTGNEGYIYFKSTYYNSITSAETSIDDSNPILADDTTRYCSIFDIRVQSGLTENTFITDDRIESKRQQAENEINSAIFTCYALPLPEVPGLIKHICTILAAGYLDYEEFGSDGEGVKWLGEARALLKGIKDRRQRLLASDYTELPNIQTTSTLQGYPNDPGGPNNDPEVTPNAFSMGMKF